MTRRAGRNPGPFCFPRSESFDAHSLENDRIADLHALQTRIGRRIQTGANLAMSHRNRAADRSRDGTGGDLATHDPMVLAADAEDVPLRGLFGLSVVQDLLEVELRSHPSSLRDFRAGRQICREPPPA